MTRGATWPASDFLTLVAKFRDERDWARFHSSKDLALSVSIEAAELLECFQWSGDDLEAPERTAEIEAEMADVLIYLAMLADHRGVDLDRAVREKLAAAARKYPATAVKGEASAARAAARAIHEEARRTGANAPAATSNRAEEEEATSSPAETSELRADSVREEAACAPAPDGTAPVRDAEGASKPEASPVSSGEEKVAEPVQAPEDPREQIRLRAARLRDRRPRCLRALRRAGARRLASRGRLARRPAEAPSAARSPSLRLGRHDPGPCLGGFFGTRRARADGDGRLFARRQFRTRGASS